jgi:tetratricopeptide (TPR) repeat protein
MGLRAAGVGPFATLLSAGVIKARDPLLMADFENRTSDSTLAQSVTEALRIDLTRSPMLKLLESEDISAALRRMEKDPSAPLTAEIAREVAERAGAAAVVTGEIAALGGGYVLSVRLLATKDGATLLAERETAKDAGGLIPAVDRLSRKLREGIGESLRTIRGGEPLEAVTTSSLEALRKYSQGNRASDLSQHEQARGLLEAAIRLDSNFAMAHRKLAVVLGNMGADNGLVVAETRKAFELRDRLPELERLWATAYFYSNVEYDSDKVIAAYRQVLDTWPDEATALNNLAIELAVRRRYVEAEKTALHGIAVNPQVGVLWINALEAMEWQGEWARADSLYAEWARIAPNNTQRYSTGFRLAIGQGNYALAVARADSVGRDPNPSYQIRNRVQRANAYRFIGQIAWADRDALAQLQIGRQTGATSLAMVGAIEYAGNEARFRQRPALALQRIDSVLARFPFDSLDPLSRPYLLLSDLYVAAGELTRAERVLTEYERDVPEQIRKGDYQSLYSKALLAWGKREYPRAVTGFREYYDKVGGNISGVYELGRTFDDMGQPDSALAAYETYVTAPAPGAAGRQWYLAAAYRRLGTLYQEKGNKDKALEYYGKFTALWKDADPDLQPAVTEVKQRMSALVGEPRRP